MDKKFNPNDYLISLKGKKYLQVAHRVLWFKTDNANGAITTDVLQTEPFPLVKAFISVDGVVIATGHGTAQTSNNAVYKGREIEKAETAAIGRALANAGYGTQFSEMVDDDSDDIADSPVELPKNDKPQSARDLAIAWARANKFHYDSTTLPNNAYDELAHKAWCEGVAAANKKVG